MSGITISEEILEDHLIKGINKWRQGDLFMSYGLSESDRILDPGAKPPDKTEKDHPFNKLLDSVATDMAQEYGLDKRERKSVLRTMYQYNKRWATVIAEKGGSDKDKAATPTKLANSQREPTKKKSKKKKLEKKTEKKKEKKAVKKKAENEKSKARSSHESSLPSNQYNQKLLEDKRKGFEKARDLILEEVPVDVKDRFGKIYFGKWGKQVLPCLVMNPYSVPPGGVRDLWLEMYDKLKASKRLESMTNLVYWYGAYDDPNSAYSFLTTKQLISYESGVKKKHDQLPPALQKKLDAGKAVPPTSLLLVNGLEEMKGDLDKRPEERRGSLSQDFIEAYAITSEDEEEEPLLEVVNNPEDTNMETEVAEFPQVKGKKAKKRKKGEDPKDDFVVGTDEENMTSRPKKAKKVKKKKKNTVEKLEPEQEQSVEAPTDVSEKNIITEVHLPVKSEPAIEAPVVLNETPDTLPQLASAKKNHLDDIGDADVSSREDPDADYNYAMAESASEDDKDDEDFYRATSGTKSLAKGKARAPKTEKKVAPKKKETKTKVKLEKPTKKEKKTISEEARRKLEHRKFRTCEKNYAHLVDRWQIAIKAKDKDDILKLYDEILPLVDQFHVAFITEYDLSPLMKQSKAIVEHPSRKKLMSALKEHYIAFKDSLPAGFKPKKMKQKEEQIQVPENSLPAKVEPSLSGKDISGSQESVVANEDSQSSLPPSPIRRVGSSDKVALPSEIDNTKEVIKEAPRDMAVRVERKKKFSLGKLMRPSSEAPKIAHKPVVVDKAPAPAQVVQKQATIPGWISGATEQAKITDDTRSFALEFLQQAAPFIPHSKHVNHSAIARALEASIYDWAKSKFFAKWVEKYWEKVDDVVAAISGDDRAGTIATMISEGKFKSADEIVKLSDNAIFDSFLGKPIQIPLS